MKNIPILGKFAYDKLFIYRAEDLAERMRWEVYWDKQKQKGIVNNSERNTYKFRTNTKAPAAPELRSFEDDLFNLLEKVERRYINDPLQEKMKEDLRNIRGQEDMIVVHSDKTAQLYSMNVKDYRAFKEREIMSKYRKVDVGVADNIDKEAASLAHEYKLEDRIEGMALSESFLTIKDHKEDFPGKLSFRLIDPNKTNIGRISKAILDRANMKVRESEELQQWRSTKDVLNWFRSLEGKEDLLWIKFDIEAFYPSITEELLRKTLIFLRQYDHISEVEEEVIYHCRRSLLVGNSGSLWQKKDNNDFDVTMGSLDGAELAESVGLYLLHRLREVDRSVAVGLYRDDGLGAVRGSRRDVDRVRKKITAIMKEEGLAITAEGGTKIVDFLDVVLNLSDGSHHPYVKPNTRTTYVSTSSNHPSVVIKEIQKGVCKRLSSNSSDAQKFSEHSAHFDLALKDAGHQGNMEFIPPRQERKKVRRKKVIWFNPPWCRSVRTNVAGKFLKLVRKHFGMGSPLYHLFNSKKLKVSYSTGSNMKQLITAHNKKVLRRAEGREDDGIRGCNCLGGVKECPLDGHCLTQSLIYSATIKMEDETRTYVGQTNNTFKKRMDLHNSDTNCGRTRCTLSAYLIEQRRRGKDPEEIRWSLIKPVKPRGKGDKYCQLCLSEKAFILRSDPELTLNKRSELLRRCRHRDSLMLGNLYSRSFERRGRRRRRLAEIDREEIIPEEGENQEDQGGGQGENPPGGTEEEEEGALERSQEEEQGGRREEREERGPGREERQLRGRERVDYRSFF